MMNMNQKGVATVAILATTAALAGGTLGAPLAVDTFSNINPDSPLYELEKMGETIRGAAIGEGQDWQLDLAEERLQEYKAMAKKNKAEKYQELLDKASQHISSAAKKSDNGKDLERVRQRLQKHVRVLENLENKVPEQARQGLEKALTQSRIQKRVIENFENKARNGSISPGQLKNRLENQLNTIDKLNKILENRNLPPGILKEIIDNKSLSKENLEKIIDGEKLPPGILKEILKNQNLTEEELNELIDDQNLPPGIRRQILDDNESENENEEDEDSEAPPFKVGKPKDFVHKKGEVPGRGQGGPPVTPPTDEEDDETSEDTGTGYNLLESGLKIKNLPASYSINPTNTEDLESNNVIREITEAFEAWDSHTSTELFSDDISTTEKSGFNQDGVNVVSFAPLEDESRIGMTKVWSEDGKVKEFDIVLNTKVEWDIDPDGEGSQTIESYDIRNIMTHEAGHALALLDIEDETYSDLTMYYQSEPGGTRKISLENGDISGLQTLYGE